MTAPQTLKVPIKVKIPESVTRRLDDLETDLAAIEADVKSRPDLVWRGRFDPNVEYETGDVVRYRGSTFRHK